MDLPTLLPFKLQNQLSKPHEQSSTKSKVLRSITISPTTSIANSPVISKNELKMQQVNSRLQNDYDSLLLRFQQLQNLLNESESIIKDQNDEILVLRHSLSSQIDELQQVACNMEEVIRLQQRQLSMLSKKNKFLENRYERGDGTDIAADVEVSPSVFRVSTPSKSESIPENFIGNEAETRFELGKIYRTNSKEMFVQERISDDLQNRNLSKQTPSPISILSKSASKVDNDKFLTDFTAPNWIINKDNFIASLDQSSSARKNDDRESNYTRSPSPSKSVIVRERDALEEELLEKYELLRTLDIDLLH